MYKLIISILILLNFCIAIENYGSFADWNAGARSLAMGRAYVALADDASAVFWNPAGLMQVKNIQATFQQVMLFEGYSSMYMGLILPGVESALGMDVLMLSGAGIEGRDMFNQSTGSFSDSKMSFGLSYTKLITNKLFLGIKGKYLSRAFEKQSDMAIGLDLSMLYFVTDKLRVGMNLVNILGFVMGNTTDVMNSSSRAGISYREGDLILNLDVGDNFSEWRLGGELTVFNMLPLRVGVNSYELSLGTGVKVMSLQFDCAYVLKELDPNICFSMSYSLANDMEDEQKNKINQYTKDAMDMLENDFYYLAKQMFMKIILLEPDREKEKIMLKRIDDALPYVESSLETETTVWPKFKEARALFEEQKYKEAERIFIEINKEIPKNRHIKDYLEKTK
ncbi:MAG: hypothetical protein PHV30_05595 [Candidatus Margulisbacteria bacterium]|nr:hypothetical protein [Candidatus Margulisiibacteriota bacterium]